VTNSVLEALLHEEEGPALDFKREQYPFEAASDSVKSELLKDILAFANSWRRSEAFILVGVDENRGARSRPLGVSHHLSDADLQQFVNSKTQRPIQFSYRVAAVDGVTIGVLEIPTQQRPFFLRQNFGKLLKGVVYLRRGSSTGEADADEIARMGSVETAIPPPELNVTWELVSAFRGEFIVSISNSATAGVARAPYLEIDPPGPFMVAFDGVDGNHGGHGLPLQPQSPGSRPKFAGTTAHVILPGTKVAIARLVWKGRQDQMPGRVRVPYRVGSEGAAVQDGELIVELPG
jgi:hypothetical protein